MDWKTLHKKIIDYERKSALYYMRGKYIRAFLCNLVVKYYKKKKGE